MTFHDFMFSTNAFHHHLPVMAPEESQRPTGTQHPTTLRRTLRSQWDQDFAWLHLRGNGKCQAGDKINQFDTKRDTLL